MCSEGGAEHGGGGGGGGDDDDDGGRRTEDGGRGEGRLLGILGLARLDGARKGSGGLGREHCLTPDRTRQDETGRGSLVGIHLKHCTRPQRETRASGTLVGCASSPGQGLAWVVARDAPRPFLFLFPWPKLPWTSQP